ncbi:gastrula zinc finger protein XlCGF66.1-like [Leptodactylus fuscus]|uniref:gastrula zinc finger protein XlCGF66.1-like n=1 Tax=Leptodactylus fuscus TaxID=238119 RepID=UPI003F4F202A
MDEDKNRMTEGIIINLTLEIIYLLTGEDYTIVKKTSMSPHSMEVGCKQPQSLFTVSLPHAFMDERDKTVKVLEITNKIIELLTGEVPIRCQDISVYFSKEEWEYAEGHKDLYKNVLMEGDQSITSPDGSSSMPTSGRCPSPLPIEDCPMEDHCIGSDHQGGGSIDIKIEVIDGEEETDVRIDQPFKEEDTNTDVCPGE